MKKTTLFRRGAALALALAMVLPMGLTARAAEEDGLCEHHPSHTADCGYAATGECTHECTAASGCVTVSCSHTHVGTCYDAGDSLICTHACTDTPACYTPVINCLHTEHTGCGHAEGADCSFAAEGCMECDAVEITGADVLFAQGTEYTYTGEEIRPQITVTVAGTQLKEEEHYTVTYADNIAAGTAAATVTGIPQGGYKGTVTMPFTISRTDDEFTLVEIQGTDVTIEGTEFAYTGESIEPAVTVTVNGTVLTAGKDYSVAYTNNVEPGTATVTVSGIATASQTLGYTGEVSIDFTIVKAETPEDPTEPETPTEPEETQPEETQPEETQPEETEPDATQPEETEPFDYQLTEGSGSRWYQESEKDLTFTVNADTRDVTAIRIDGKKIGSSCYSLGDDGVITLKQSFLDKLDIGTYRITVEFADGEAEGSFRVAAALDPTNPTTGDTITRWIAIMALSMLAATGLILFIRKKA